jgi:hypothetical protein
MWAGRTGYLLLGAVAAFLLGLLIVSGRPTSERPVLVEPTPYRLFPELTDPAQIIGMELTLTATRQQIAVVVEEDGLTWRLRDAPYTLLKPEGPRLARDLLGLMVSLRQLRGGQAADFGLLPNAQYVVRFQKDDLRIVTLYIGDQTPTGEGYYVAFSPESAIVEVVSTQWVDNFVLTMLTFEPLSAQPLAVPSEVPN